MDTIKKILHQILSAHVYLLASSDFGYLLITFANSGRTKHQTKSVSKLLVELLSERFYLKKKKF